MDTKRLFEQMRWEYLPDKKIPIEECIKRRVQISSPVLSALDYIITRYPELNTPNFIGEIVSLSLNSMFREFLEENENHSNKPSPYHKILLILNCLGWKNSTYYISIARNIFGIDVRFSQSEDESIFTDQFISAFSENFELNTNWLLGNETQKGSLLPKGVVVKDPYIVGTKIYNSDCVDSEIFIFKATSPKNEDHYWVGQLYNLCNGATSIKGWNNIVWLSTNDDLAILISLVKHALTEYSNLMLVDIDYKVFIEHVLGQTLIWESGLLQRGIKAKKIEIDNLIRNVNDTLIQLDGKKDLIDG